MTEPSQGRIGKFSSTSSTPTIANFPQSGPLGSGASPYGIAAGVDQGGHTAIWFTDKTNSAIESFNPSTGSFSTPIALAGKTDQNGSAMFGFTNYGSQMVAGTDADHTLWFTERNASTGEFAIGGYDPKTGSWYQVKLPAGADGNWETPNGLTAAANGAIWFTESVSKVGAPGIAYSSIWEIVPGSEPATHEYQVTNPATGQPVSPAPLAFGITTSPDGNIWFTDNDLGAIYKFDPSTQLFATEAVTTTSTPILQGITTGPDGNIWFADSIGAIDVKHVATHLVVSSAPMTGTAGTGFSVSVTAEDASGNVDPTYTGNITMNLASNPGGNLAQVTVAASQGVATFSGLVLDTAGGYSVAATAPGLSAANPSNFSIVAAAASRLVLTQQPPSSVSTGAGFPVTLVAKDKFNNLTTFSGSVYVALSSSPGTILTSGVMNGPSLTFPSLTLSSAGSDQLVFSAAGLASATSTSVQVQSPAPPPPPVPYVMSAAVVTTQKTNKHGKPMGRPVLGGYRFSFSQPMNSSTADNFFNYQVETGVRVRVKSGRSYTFQTRYKPIGFSVQYLSNTSVELVTGKQAFKYGGQIVLTTSAPSGISSAAGAYLTSSDALFVIARGGLGISLA